MKDESRVAGEFAGTWRIVETEVWDSDALDLLESASLVVEPDGSGLLVFIAIYAGIDYRVGQRDGVPCLEFTWEGSSEGDSICGRGWAKRTGNQLDGRLYIHGGDDSAFRARRARPV